MEYQNRNTKAEQMKQRFETITREYTQQNKAFADKHNMIKAEETKKRQEIIENFD